VSELTPGCTVAVSVNCDASQQIGGLWRCFRRERLRFCSDALAATRLPRPRINVFLTHGETIRLQQDPRPKAGTPLTARPVLAREHRPSREHASRFLAWRTHNEIWVHPACWRSYGPVWTHWRRGQLDGPVARISPIRPYAGTFAASLQAWSVGQARRLEQPIPCRRLESAPAAAVHCLAPSDAGMDGWTLNRRRSPANHLMTIIVNVQ